MDVDSEWAEEDEDAAEVERGELHVRMCFLLTTKVAFCLSYCNVISVFVVLWYLAHNEKKKRTGSRNEMHAQK